MTVVVAFSGLLQFNLLSWVTGVDMPSAPASVKFGLLTAIPSHDGMTLNELSGHGYARQTVTFGSVTTDNTNRVTSVVNSTPVIFGPVTGVDWLQVTYGAYFDGDTGDLLTYGPLAAARLAPVNDTISFGAGSLEVRSQ